MKSTSSDRKQCVSVVAPNWLGDAVMARALIGMLAASGVRLSVVAPPYTSTVYRGMAELDELVVDGEDGRLRRIAARTAMFRALRPDAVVLLPPSFSSSLPPWLAGVPVRTGDASDGRRALLSDALDPPASRAEHLSQTYLRLGRVTLEKLGLEEPQRWLPAELNVSEADREEARRLCRDAGVTGHTYAVIVPGATFGPAKAWPGDRFGELCGKIVQTMPVMVAGGAREEAMCATVCQGKDGVHNVAGQTSLGGFMALMEAAAVVVANDSGSPHLSAAMGTPTVTLFGSTSPDWTSPLGAHVEVVQHPVDCNPCFRRTCPTQLECFIGIEVDDVHAPVIALLSARFPQAHGVSDPA